MDVINLKRNSGKTTMIVEWLKKSPKTRIMVVYDFHEKLRIMKESGLEYGQVWTFEDTMKQRLFGYGRRGEMMIDNLDVCLLRAMPYSDAFNLVGFSITDE